MDVNLVRIKNDKTYQEEWANREVESMSLNDMVKYIYSPNSSYLGVAIQERLKKELSTLDKLNEVKEELQYLLTCVETHVNKFPVPDHMTSRIEKIRKALF